MKKLATATFGLMILAGLSGCSDELQAHPSSGTWMGPRGSSPGWHSSSGGYNHGRGMMNGGGSWGSWGGHGSWQPGAPLTAGQQKAHARLWAKYGKQIDGARIKLLKVETELRRLQWSARPDSKAIAAKAAEASKIRLELRQLYQRYQLEMRKPAVVGRTVPRQYGWHGGCGCGGCGW